MHSYTSRVKHLIHLIHYNAFGLDWIHGILERKIITRIQILFKLTVKGTPELAR